MPFKKYIPAVRARILQDQTPFNIVNLSNKSNRRFREIFGKIFWAPLLNTTWSAIRINTFEPRGAFYTKDRATIKQYYGREVPTVDADRLLHWIETGEDLKLR